MGVDIHAYVECDFQNSIPPFSSPQSVRCINSGEFFIWRDCPLFHTLGLDYWSLDIPQSPTTLGRLPNCLSKTIVDQHALILSPHVCEETPTSTHTKFPTSVTREWKDQGLQYFSIPNHEHYCARLREHETLLFDPGNELPNFVSPEQIHCAMDTCKPSGDKINYFLAIVSLMEKMADSLSDAHVRMVYWFDNLAPNYMHDYHKRFGIGNHWPDDIIEHSS